MNRSGPVLEKGKPKSVGFWPILRKMKWLPNWTRDRIGLVQSSLVYWFTDFFFSPLVSGKELWLSWEELGNDVVIEGDEDKLDGKERRAPVEDAFEEPVEQVPCEARSFFARNMVS